MLNVNIDLCHYCLPRGHLRSPLHTIKKQWSFPLIFWDYRLWDVKVFISCCLCIVYTFYSTAISSISNFFHLFGPWEITWHCFYPISPFPRANCTNLHISRTWDTSPLERALNIKVSLTSSLVLPTSSPSLHKMRKNLLTIDYLDVSKTKVKSIITSLAQTQMLN